MKRLALLLSTPLLLLPMALEAKAELRDHAAIAHCGSCQIDQQKKTSKDAENNEGSDHNHESDH